jgi:hypothetical protein
MPNLAYFAPRCRLKMLHAHNKGRSQGARRRASEEEKTAGGAGKPHSASPASLEGQPATEAEMDRAAALIQAAAPSAPGGANAAELEASAPGGANAADLNAAAALIQGAAPCAAGGASAAELDRAAALIQSAAPAAARGASAAELEQAAALIQGAAPAASAGGEDPTERKLRLGHLLSADEVEEQKRRAAREEEAEKADGTS